MTADAATIRATVEAYCAAFTAGDQDAYLALFAPDAWIEDPVGHAARRGPRGASAGSSTQTSAMADSIELRQTGPVRVAVGECAFPMQARPVIGGATLRRRHHRRDDLRRRRARSPPCGPSGTRPRCAPPTTRDGRSRRASASSPSACARCRRCAAFYTGLGWAEQPGASDQFCAYLLGGVLLALYGIDDLAHEAAPGEPLTKHGWGGHTFALNVDERDQVDEVVRAMVAAGARKVGQVIDRPWGGRSGYVADPEGNRWEVAWAPGLRVRRAWRRRRLRRAGQLAGQAQTGLPEEERGAEALAPGGEVGCARQAERPQLVGDRAVAQLEPHVGGVDQAGAHVHRQVGAVGHAVEVGVAGGLDALGLAQSVPPAAR